jgi:hypothetical protein
VANARLRTVSAADVTREYVDDHPSIREGLREDLLNFTALARRLQGERNLRNEEAVTIACRRYQRELARETPQDGAIRKVLAASRIQVHSRVALVRVRDDSATIDRILELARTWQPLPTGRQVFEVFQGTRATTVLCDESILTTLLPEIPARVRVAVEKGLAIIAFRSRPEVTETPGVLAFIVETLFRRGINCLETVSVHTDSIFVFRDKEVIRAYQALSDLVPADALPASTTAHS